MIKHLTIAIFVILAGHGATADGQPAPERPRAIASEPQLFLDEWIVERSRGIARTLHRPTKHGLIKHADGSDWERGDCYVDGGHIATRDRAGRFHLTYRYHWWDPAVSKLHPSIGEDKAHWFRESVAYATSDDGIRWHRPKLGLAEGPTGFKKITGFPFEVPTGMSKENNLGCPFDFIVDLHAHGNIAEPNQRYLLRLAKRDDTHPFAKVTEASLHFAPDWPDFAHDPKWREKLIPVNGTLSPRGFRSLAGYDHDARLWFAVSQDSIGNWLKRNGRDVARYTTPDFVHWSGPELVLPVPKDESRRPEDWVEYMSMNAYRVGGPKSGAWLGQLNIFRSDRRDPQGMMPTIPNVWRKGLTEVRLVISRDAGKTWQCVAGTQAWLTPHAEENGYDRLVFGANPVRVGDELWFYYTAWDGDHLVFNRDGATYYKDRVRMGRTARATLRLDGYVSLDAGKERGEIVTRPLTLTGHELVVNLAAPKGELRVEVQDEVGKPIPGFTHDDCVPAKGDGVCLPVRWRTNAELAKLSGRPVRLHFNLTQASLYSFQVR